MPLPFVGNTSPFSYCVLVSVGQRGRGEGEEREGETYVINTSLSRAFTSTGVSIGRGAWTYPTPLRLHDRLARYVVVFQPPLRHAVLLWYDSICGLQIFDRLWKYRMNV